MKYINIMGPVGDFDRVVEKYISNYDIQLEDSHKELSETYEMFAFPQGNPYAVPMYRAQKLIKLTLQDVGEKVEVSNSRALQIIDTACEYYEKRDSRVKELEGKRELYASYIRRLEPFIGLEFCVEQLAEFEFIRYRFGRMPYGSFKQFETYLYGNKSILFEGGRNDGEYVYGIFFVTKNSKQEADNILNSFQFERIWITYELDVEALNGTPKQIYEKKKQELLALEQEIKELHSQGLVKLDIAQGELAASLERLEEIYYNYEARKFATRIKNEFYVFVGWMKEADARRLEKEMDTDSMVVLTICDEGEALTSAPPTRLRNSFFVKPFEFFVKMYATPSYKEVDPTVFVAITYTLMFGFMFGDFGQGAVLLLLGLYLKNKRKMDLGGIIATIGVSSMFFGFMFGSVFGFEEVIHPYWLHPINNINTILIVAVLFGVMLNYIAMLINMYSAAKQHYLGEILLSQNGLAGMVFYSAMLGLVLLVLTGSNITVYAATIPMLISFLVIVMKEPLANLLSGERPILYGSFPKYIFESSIEFIEVLLSYFTNTISFVRVGAFALSHAGMMSVVMMLSKTVHNDYNMFIVVVGNIIVIALEGLVVGIQVLRLEYYEMFSRFFRGKGREFISYRKKRTL